MAEQIRFDDGVKEYQINDNGVLRMNPTDPNLFQRFFDAQDRLLEIEQNLEKQGREIPHAAPDAPKQAAAAVGAQVTHLMADADRQVKNLLGEVFPGNDFFQLFGGVNVMAVAGNHERVVTNFFNALVPILTKGAQTYADDKAQAAVAKSNANRAQRRAKKRHRGKA